MVKYYKSVINFQDQDYITFDFPKGLSLVDNFACYVISGEVASEQVPFEEIEKYLYKNINYRQKEWLKNQGFWRKYTIEEIYRNFNRDNEHGEFSSFAYRAFVYFRSEESKLLYDLAWANEIKQTIQESN